MPAENASKGWLGRYGGIAAFALVSLALASGAVALLLKSQSSPAIEIILPPPTSATPWQVYITGAVATPGRTYSLSGDATLEGALQAAGGLTQGAGQPRVQVHVPPAELTSDTSPEGPAPGSSPLPSFPPEQSKVNINTASAKELANRLPGIGPTLAERIVQYRKTYGPFQRIEDIVDVPGIGPGIFDKIRDFTSVGP